MPNSSASDVMFLPFGSLTGVVPIDAISRGRVLGEFGTILAGQAHRSAEQPVALVERPNPACAASPPSFEKGDGGIWL